MNCSVLGYHPIGENNEKDFGDTGTTVLYSF